MANGTTIERVNALVAPIVGDLHLELYDLEMRGGTLRVTLDTPPGAGFGVDLDTLALATRLISRELDHADPVPGRYTLEVTSPGLERSLRTAQHFARAIGSQVAVRLRDIGEGGERRVNGELVAADERTVTVRQPGDAGDTSIDLDRIDRARTVFTWGPSPKPGGKAAGKSAARARAAANPAPGDAHPDNDEEDQ